MEVSRDLLEKLPQMRFLKPCSPHTHLVPSHLQEDSDIASRISMLWHHPLRILPHADGDPGALPRQSLSKFPITFYTTLPAVSLQTAAPPDSHNILTFSLSFMKHTIFFTTNPMFSPLIKKKNHIFNHILKDLQCLCFSFRGRIP